MAGPALPCDDGVERCDVVHAGRAAADRAGLNRFGALVLWAGGGVASGPGRVYCAAVRAARERGHWAPSSCAAA